MKTSTIHAIFLSAALALTSQLANAGLFSGWGKSVTGSGKILVQERSTGHFQSVELALPATLELRQGDKEGIQIETDDNLQALIETTVEHGNLRIRPTEKNLQFDTKTLKLIVYLKDISDLTVAGSATVLSEKLASANLSVSLGGAGDIAFKNLRATSLRVTIGGSGSFSSAGTATQVSSSIGGSGVLNIDQLDAREVSISIGGSGQARVWARDSLNASVAGSGNVRYYGDPKVAQSISGSGRVTRQGAAPR